MRCVLQKCIRASSQVPESQLVFTLVIYACQLWLLRYSVKLQSPFGRGGGKARGSLCSGNSHSLIGPCGHSWPACQIIVRLSEEIQMTMRHGLVAVLSEVMLTKGVQVISFAVSALINGCYMISKDISFLMKQMRFDGKPVMNRLAGFPWSPSVLIEWYPNSMYKAYTVFTGKNKHFRRDFWGLRERESGYTQVRDSVISLIASSLCR